jgi:tRNA pseudouridine38-40 synthase|tara:strand:+ start:1192 stop:1938 length:747 start_codon:yes stop_codon:yes gene_type:complete
MMRYFIDISYNGKNYHGWQIQKNAVTVQSTIQDVISKILGKSTDIVGSGRTDTGVHAKSQVAHFDVNKEVDNDFIYRVNAFLPQDISINSVNQVVDNSHARFDAISREYIYKIHDLKSPFVDGLSTFYNKKINMDLINEACSTIMKNSDFQSFSKVKTEVKNFNCIISHASIRRKNNFYLFKFCANRFLRGMVRALVGTLLQLNEGKINLKEFKLIFEKKNREYAGPSAPPYGLYLNKVNYNSDIFHG